jgi:uncharacterized protein
MTLEETVMGQLKDAMRAKDTNRLNALRNIKAAILYAKTDGSGQVVDAAREMQILQKLAKQRQDSLTIFEQQNREDLAAVERAELLILREFLPAMMSQEALDAKITELIAAVGATGPKDMGKVMGSAMKQLNGQAEGSAISETVKRLLGA